MTDPALTVDGRLRLQGDWGAFNLTRACGWLAFWVYEQTPEHRRSLILTGRGMGDSFRALAHGLTDIAIATPACFARLAYEGLGPFAGHAISTLRALAVLPHRDAMIAVARADLGFTRLADAAAHPGPLRIALGTNDPDGFMGFAGDLLMESAGVGLPELLAKGGTVIRHEQPFESITDLREGRVDIMISEAIMTPDWVRLATDAPVTFLPVTDPQQRWLADRYGLGLIDIPGGFFPGVPVLLPALDYSGWIITTTDALPDADAALVARAVIENSEVFAAQYRHLPADRSPLTYPITVDGAVAASIPLHPAAAAVYDRASTG